MEFYVNFIKNTMVGISNTFEMAEAIKESHKKDNAEFPESIFIGNFKCKTFTDYELVKETFFIPRSSFTFNLIYCHTCESALLFHRFFNHDHRKHPISEKLVIEDNGKRIQNPCEQSEIYVVVNGYGQGDYMFFKIEEQAEKYKNELIAEYVNELNSEEMVSGHIKMCPIKMNEHVPVKFPSRRGK